MGYEYADIVRQWYEELKTPFINCLYMNFPLGYDEIMDIYQDVWMDVRDMSIDNFMDFKTEERAVKKMFDRDRKSRLAFFNKLDLCSFNKDLATGYFVDDED